MGRNGMGRNGHGPKWLWAEMTRDLNIVSWDKGSYSYQYYKI